MGEVVKRVLILGLLALVWLMPRPALAQPSAANVYDDIKEVIEELVTKEVAEVVAPNLACYSKDGLLRYFPRTLQLVFERNLGMLEDTLREETIEFLGNYTYESLRQGKAVPLSELLPISPPEYCRTPSDCECARKIRELHGPEPYVKYDKKQRNWEYPLDACRGDRKPPTNKEEAKGSLHCEMVASMVDAVRDRKDSATEHMARAIALIAYLRADFPNMKPESTKRIIDEIVKAVQDQLQSGKYSDRSKLSLLEKVSSSRLDELVGGKSLDQLISERQPRTSRKTLAAAIAIKLMAGAKPTLVLRSRVGPDKAKAKPDDAQPFDAREALEEILAATSPQPTDQPSSTSIVRALLEHHGIVPYGTATVQYDATTSQFSVELSGDKASETFAVVGSGLAALEKLIQGVSMADEFDTRLDDLSSPQALANLALAVVRVAGDVVSVVQSWERIFKESGSLQPKRMLEAIKDRCGDGQVSGQTATGKPTMKIDICSLVDQAFLVFDPTGELQPLIVAALDGDLREVAAAGVRAVFSASLAGRLCCDAEDETSCTRRVDAYANLATSFVSYATLKENDTNGEVAARTAFKRAAFDVVTDLGSRKGYDRAPWQRSYIPTASLRASLSPSYYNQGADGFRYLATVDWLTYPFLLRDRESVRMELQVTLVDILAPFSEIAFRHIDTRYQDTPAVFANFLRPSVELALGVPTLTTKLMLVGGGSLRPVIAKKKSDTSEFDYQYLFFGTKEAGDGFHWDGLLNSLEFGIGVKYVP